MSTGSIIGATVGAVIGFFIGGPIGAVYGAGVGFSIGMMVDPIVPDISAVGTPDQQGLQIMTSEIGTPIFDVLGTVKCTGNLLWYGLERSVAQTQKTSGGGKGGGGGEETQVTGYKYYMSWAMGLCLGKVNTLYAVYKNDDLVWEGILDLPASGGEETITLSENMGSAVLYFGTDDQVANAKMGAALEDPTLNPPYRGLCWAYFDDCYIGDYNRCPTMKFVMRKSPTCSFDSERTFNDIQVYDYNPMHAIWYVLYNMTGLPESWLHDADFLAAATTIFKEYRGVSILFDRSQAAMSYLETINAHIDNILKYGIDAKFHPKLIRDDYTVGDLLTVNEDVLLDEPAFERKSWIDTINEVKVQYSEIVNVERSKGLLDIWTQMADFPGEERVFGVAGSAGGKAYAGMGMYVGADPEDIALGDWYRYDPDTDSWVQKASLLTITNADYNPGDPVSGRQQAVAIGCGDYIYAGLGLSNRGVGGTANQYNDWYMYDPVFDTWTRKANFPGGYVRQASIASVGGKVYVGFGVDNAWPIYRSQWYEYDPDEDDWTEIDNPGNARYCAGATGCAGKVYAGGGYNNETSYQEWKAYTLGGNWAFKTGLPTNILRNFVAESMRDKVYAGTGVDVGGAIDEWWEFDPDTNAWVQKAAFGGGIRAGAVVAGLTEKIFVGTGSGVEGYKNDWWKYK